MRYEIDTIPVWDAVKSGCECWLCELESRSRNQALKYYLGPSVMVPETRVTVNETGFDRDHWRLLAKDSNRQGLGLIVSTHLRTLAAKVQGKIRGLDAQARKLGEKSGPGALLASKDPLKKAVGDLKTFLQDQDRACLIRTKVEEDVKRYAFTAVHLYQKDSDFPPALKASKGPCLVHLPVLLDMGLEVLPPNLAGTWACLQTDLAQKSLARLEAEVVKFTQMFDSKNLQADWGGTEDAPERAIQKITGAFRERENVKNKR